MPEHRPMPGQSRRYFLGVCSTVFAGFLPGVWPGSPPVARRQTSPPSPPPVGPHPMPRPGITAAKVLTKDQLTDSPRAIPVFDMVREIPEVVDGIRCQCGCADTTGYYSLLSCYEGDAMARSCSNCQGEGRLAYRLHRDGKSLDEIRAAIESRFG